jgi:hypothetical protein
LSRFQRQGGDFDFPSCNRKPVLQTCLQLAEGACPACRRLSPVFEVVTKPLVAQKRWDEIHSNHEVAACEARHGKAVKPERNKPSPLWRTARIFVTASNRADRGSLSWAGVRLHKDGPARRPRLSSSHRFRLEIRSVTPRIRLCEFL